MKVKKRQKVKTSSKNSLFVYCRLERRPMNFLLNKDSKIHLEITSGLTVALTLIPQVILFSYIAGINPFHGLLSTIVLLLVSTLIGGRTGLVSGVSGATAVLMVKIFADYGINHLYLTVIVMGAFQILVGLFGLGRFIRLLPRTVFLGYVNGAAFLILLSQLDFFRTNTNGIEQYFDNQNLLYSLLIIVGVIGSAYFIKSKTGGPWRFIIPLIFFSIVCSIFHIPVENIHDYLVRTSFIDHINTNTDFQPFTASSTDFTFNSVQESLITGIVLGIIGLTETLMALAYVDDKLGHKGNANKESLAQGIGNLLCGILGGIGGAGLLGQSAINAKSNTSTRLSTLSTVLFLIVISLTVDNILIYIPTAVVTGIMFFIAIDIFNMSIINNLKNMPKSDAFTLIFVTCATIILKPTMAVISGIIFSALVFSWENATRIRVRKKTDQEGRKHYEIYGPLFFASTSMFLGKFDIETDPEEIVLNFSESRIWDQSGIESIIEICNHYAEVEKNVSIIHLSRDSKMLIEKMGNENIHIIVDKKDPVYHVVGENTLRWKR